MYPREDEVSLVHPLSDVAKCHSVETRMPSGSGGEDRTVRKLRLTWRMIADNSGMSGLIGRHSELSPRLAWVSSGVARPSHLNFGRLTWI